MKIRFLFFTLIAFAHSLICAAGLLKINTPKGDVPVFFTGLTPISALKTVVHNHTEVHPVNQVLSTVTTQGCVQTTRLLRSNKNKTCADYGLQPDSKVQMLYGPEEYEEDTDVKCCPGIRALLAQCFAFLRS
jgi:hypothetical protein